MRVALYINCTDCSVCNSPFGVVFSFWFCELGQSLLSYPWKGWIPLFWSHCYEMALPVGALSTQLTLWDMCLSYPWLSSLSLTSYFMPGCFMKLEHFCRMNHKYLFSTDTILNFNEKTSSRVLEGCKWKRSGGPTSSLPHPHPPKSWTRTMCMGAYCLDTQIPWQSIHSSPCSFFKINFELILVVFSGYPCVEL